MREKLVPTATALVLALLLSPLLPPVGVGAERPQDGPSATTAPPGDRARGMSHDGLRPGAAGGPCDGSFELAHAGGSPGCTHGPDPSPDGVDVREERSTEALDASTATVEPGTGVVACIDDGQSGSRVQAVYAVAEDRVDRYAEIAPLITQWAVAADAVFSRSAQRTGGDRHVRWVTEPDCSLSVAHVVVPSTADDTLSNLVSALYGQGYDRTDRKYLIWADATVYCGIANIYGDDQPGPTNTNNGRYPGYARVDAGCWGRPASVEAHELMHSLGGVQRSAPHATSGFHCSDEWDRMCYADAPGVSMTYPCGSADEGTFDCGHDDYFHASPPEGSYLATHWNTADSAFLTGAVTAAPPPADDAPPPVPTGLSAQPGDGSVALRWDAVVAPDLSGYELRRDGVVVATPSSTSYTDTGLLNRATYSYTVAAVDAAGNVSPPSATVTATPQATTVTTETTGRLTRKKPSAAHRYDSGAGELVARLRVTATGGSGSVGPEQTSVTVTLWSPNGTVVARATAAGTAEVRALVPRGTYVVEITGPSNTSYALEVTRPPG
jgi:chitodextrinase